MPEKEYKSGFVHPKPGVNDNFDVNNLLEIIKFIKSDIASAEKWIAKYRKDKLNPKFKNPRFQLALDDMIANEIKGRKASEEELSYYKAELDEEYAKIK